MGKITRASLVLAAALVLLAGPGARAATFANLGFEAGDANWDFTNTSTGHHEVCDAAACGVAPYAGANYLRLEAGDGDFYVKAVQQITLAQGEVISGAARFFPNDDFANDNAHVQLRNAEGSVVGTPWAADQLNPGPDEWTKWSWTAPAAGQYELRYAVRNLIDSRVDSAAMFDSAESTLVAHGSIVHGAAPVLNLRAELTRSDDGSPIAGQLISFTIGGNAVCSDATDGNGIALCGGVLAAAQSAAGYTAEFDGSLDALPSQANGTIVGI